MCVLYFRRIILNDLHLIMHLHILKLTFILLTGVFLLAINNFRSVNLTVWFFHKYFHNKHQTWYKVLIFTTLVTYYWNCGYNVTLHSRHEVF